MSECPHRVSQRPPSGIGWGGLVETCACCQNGIYYADSITGAEEHARARQAGAYLCAGCSDAPQHEPSVRVQLLAYARSCTTRTVEVRTSPAVAGQTPSSTCSSCGGYANATVQVGAHGRRLVCEDCITLGGRLKPYPLALLLRYERILPPQATGETQ